MGFFLYNLAQSPGFQVLFYKCFVLFSLYILRFAIVAVEIFMFTK